MSSSDDDEFVPGPVTAEDLAVANAMRAAGRERCELRDRIIDRVSAFTRSCLAVGITGDRDVVDRFLAHASGQGESATTVALWREIIRTNRIVPSNLHNLRRSVPDDWFLTGLRVLAEREQAEIRGATVDDVFALTRRLPGDGAKDLVYRALLALTAVTGNHLKHIYEAPAITCTAAGVQVMWAPRNATPASSEPMLYRYRWSAALDPEIVAVIGRLGGRRWGLSKTSAELTSRLENWAFKRAKKHRLALVATTTGRSALKKRLVRKLVRGRMSEASYTALLDQKPAAALRSHDSQPL